MRPARTTELLHPARTPPGTRTPNPLIKSQLLYPLSQRRMRRRRESNPYETSLPPTAFEAVAGAHRLASPSNVGMAGFEPTTPGSRNRCATKLRHIPFTAVSPGGLEPPASALSGRRSDLLSYGDKRGEREIRTLGAGRDPHYGLAIRRHRPLGQLSIAPCAGIEPATSRSTGACSPTELTRQKVDRGPGRSRTGCLRCARAALYQLSYEPLTYVPGARFERALPPF